MESSWIVGNWHLDSASNNITSGPKKIHLEQKHFQLLVLLAQNAPAPVSKQEIFTQIWRDRIVSDDALYVAINALRTSLGDNKKSPTYIKTLSGKGYQLIANVRKFQASHEDELDDELREKYQRARFLVEQGDTRRQECIDLLHEVICHQPNFAPAYLNLANAMIFNIFSESTELTLEKKRVEKLLLRALAIDSNEKSAHLMLANLYFLVFKDHQKAHFHFQQVDSLPYSHYSFAQFLLTQFEFDEAFKVLQKHLQCYPSDYSKESVAWFYCMQRDYEKSHQEIEKIREFAEENMYYHVSLQAIYEQRCEHDKSFDELYWLMRDAGYEEYSLRTIREKYNESGLKGAYHWLATKDTQHLNLGQYHPPLSTARYAIGANEIDLALDCLEQAEFLYRPELLWLGVDPKYIPLHNEPRYQAILKRLNLPLPPVLKKTSAITKDLPLFTT